MKRVAIVSLVVCLAASSAAAQDAVTSNPGVYKVVLDNARVRVLRASVAPGSSTVMHEHPDNVVVGLSDAKVRFTGADGTSQVAELQKDNAFWSPAGKHKGENLGGAVDALIIEIKGPTGPAVAAAGGSPPGLNGTPVFDNARVEVVKATPDASFKEPAGTTHAWDGVVVALAPSDTRVTVDGKTKDSWQRGDVLFIGRNAAHETAGGQKSGAVLIVRIK
jgi:quercetin dioxygenase-like cupin family protein